MTIFHRLRPLTFELRTVLEALSHGIKLLLNKYQDEPTKSELLVLESFAIHAVDAMASLDEHMAVLLGSPLQAATRA